MKEKVDILMTTFNTDIDYLKKQIDSILNQTYKNISLLISDDNSTKKEITGILEEYEKQDDRVKIYVQKNNLGYIKNFEFLLKKSTANYIMFSDHDDIWYENKVEKSLNKLIDSKMDLVYCNAKQVDENENVIKENYFKYKNVPLITGTSKLAISRCIGIGCSQIFTKNVRDKMLPFTDSVIAHDWLAAFIANEDNGITYIDEPLFGYRLHNTNVFGGRNLAQNLKRWKDENGKTYKSYLKYREEKVIDKAYLNGAKMCLEYTKKDENKIFLNKVINYYKNIKKSKYINFHIIKFFEILSGKNLLKKMIKELIIFHFPIMGYLIFLK